MSTKALFAPYIMWLVRVLAMLLLVATAIASAAQVAVTGSVTDENALPLPGATVVVRGSNVGTVTDVKGMFTITAPDLQAVLVFSFVGYEKQEVPVDGRSQLHVSLIPEIVRLTDVVVVAFGVQKKVNVTGAVTALDANQIANRGNTNVSATLVGQSPGVTLLQRGGSPGRNEGAIRIRGVGTVGADEKNNPLIIVDGIETGSLVEIDPNDVANISVLKDAAAAAIYGVRAANGVILVTTKRGQKGAPVLQYNFQAGVSHATMLPDKASAWELATLHNEANTNVGGQTLFKLKDLEAFSSGSDMLTHPNVSQVDAILSQAAIRHTHNLGLSGGSELVQYNVSYGNTHEGGLMHNTGLDRYTLRVNLDQHLAASLTTGLNLFYSARDITDPVDGVGGILHRAYREWPTDNFVFGDGRWAYPTYSGLDHNAVAYLSDRGRTKTTDNKLMGTFFVEYEPLKGLKLKGIAANTRDMNFAKSVMRAIDLYTLNTFTGDISNQPNPSHPATSSSVANQVFSRSDLNLQLLVNYELSKKNHYLKSLLGYNQRSEVKEWLGASRRDLNPALDVINGASSNPQDAATSGTQTDYRLRSLFGRMNYAFRDRYLVEANVRYDGTSRFPKSKRYQAFPSLSAGWIISEEPMLRDNSFVSHLKLRASWGRLGNQEIGDYSYINRVDVNSTTAIIGHQQLAGATEAFQLANEVIRWETTTSTDVGIDAEFLQGRLVFTGDYFVKETNDILFTVEQPRILGAYPPVSNAGSIQNKGFELALAWRSESAGLRYNLSANISYVKNTITSLGDEDVRVIDGFRYEKGQPISSIYGFVSEGLYTSLEDVARHADQTALTGYQQPGDIKYVDLNFDGAINNDDRTMLGSYFPSFNYGLSANVYWKNFDLSMLWQGVSGVDAYVTGRLARPFVLSNAPLQIQYDDRARVQNGVLINPDANFPRTLFNNPNNYTGEVADGRANSFFVESTAFLKLRNIQLGYNLPHSLVGRMLISKARLYVSGENLLTISPFNYYQVDPEIPSTGDPVPTYPTVRTWYMGLNLTF